MVIVEQIFVLIWLNTPGQADFQGSLPIKSLLRYRRRKWIKCLFMP